uniref:(northern house mosquito) hypothetical protein n=2 Tax=Culex pipiens TaxID=7175 RepID=A0A8D8KMW3_CULPI
MRLQSLNCSFRFADVRLWRSGRDAGADRFARAHQRTGTDRVGGFLHGYEGGGRRRVHHDLRHAAQFDSADDDDGQSEDEGERGPREDLCGCGVLGRGRSGQCGRAARDDLRRGCGVQVLFVSQRGGRVWARQRERSARGVAEDGGNGVGVGVPRGGRMQRSPGPRSRREPQKVPNLPPIPTGPDGSRSDRPGRQTLPTVRRPLSHRAPVRGPRPARNPDSPCQRGPTHGRNLPPLPVNRRRGHPRRAHRVQVLPPHPSPLQPRTPLASRLRRRHQHGRVGPLAEHPRHEAAHVRQQKPRRLPQSLGRHLVRPVRPPALLDQLSTVRPANPGPRAASLHGTGQDVRTGLGQGKAGGRLRWGRLRVGSGGHLHRDEGHYRVSEQGQSVHG